MNLVWRSTQATCPLHLTSTPCPKPAYQLEATLNSGDIIMKKMHKFVKVSLRITTLTLLNTLLYLLAAHKAKT